MPHTGSWTGLRTATLWSWSSSSRGCVLSNSCAGQKRTASSEKGTKQGGDSCLCTPRLRRKAFQKVALDFPAPASAFAGACS